MRLVAPFRRLYLKKNKKTSLPADRRCLPCCQKIQACTSSKKSIKHQGCFGRDEEDRLGHVIGNPCLSTWLRNQLWLRHLKGMLGHVIGSQACSSARLCNNNSLETNLRLVSQTRLMRGSRQRWLRIRINSGWLTTDPDPILGDYGSGSDSMFFFRTRRRKQVKNRTRGHFRQQQELVWPYVLS